MLCGLLAPESICYKSFRERITAKRFADRWNEFAPQHAISLKQAFYLIAGGLKIECFDRPPEEPFDPYIDMAAFCYDLTNFKDDGMVFKSRFIESVSSALPSDAEIGALSKADYLTKLITCLQALWSLVQVVGRLAWKMHISLLEALTAGFVVITLLTYCFWFRKPYNIGLARHHKASDSVIKTAWTHIHTVGERRYANGDIYDNDNHTNALAPFNRYIGLKLSLDPQLEYFRECKTDETTRPPPTIIMDQVPVMLFGLILAATHLAAWFYPFPTDVEMWMWRVSSMLLGAAPFIYCFWRYFDDIWKYGPRDAPPEKAWLYKIMRRVNEYFWFSGLSAYVIVRTYMIVEVFLSLRAAPAGVYDTPNWTSYWLHIG